MNPNARFMYRYQVPVDDQAHIIELNHNPVAVALNDRDKFTGFSVEFWAEHTEGAATNRRAFQVFGTGHEIPLGARWVGTCPRHVSGLVFHLYELTP